MRSKREEEIAGLFQHTWTPPAELPDKGTDMLLTRAWLAMGNIRLHVRRLGWLYGDEAEEQIQPLLDGATPC